MIESITNWSLHAYVDGELDGKERADVEKRLKDDAEARDFVEAIRHQKQALHDAYDDVLRQSVPVSLVNVASQTESWRVGRWAAMAACVALLAFGSTAGWFAALNTGPTLAVAMSQRALVAHAVYAVDKRHAVEVKADEREHLQAWLSKRIGAEIAIPDLTAQGFTFLGGRLLAAEDRPAGQLMYEDANQRRLAVFLARNPGGKEAILNVQQKDNLVVCYWLDQTFGMAVTAELPRERVMELAKLVYDQLEKD